MGNYPNDGWFLGGQCELRRNRGDSRTSERTRCNYFCLVLEIRAANGDSTMLLEVVWKRNDEWGIDLFNVQACWLLMQVRLCECQELTECVSIGTDSVRTCLAFPHQSPCEKRLQ